jgi:hypothetical protein
MEAPRLGGGAGQRAWSNYRAARRVTLVLTSGEAGETWAVVAAKGAKAQKIGL